MILKIDINCDMGESIKDLENGSDEALMPFISSVNIACGFHAGNEHIMVNTIKNAQKYGLNIGAHPGFNDKNNFGRVNMNLSKEELTECLFYQINLLKVMVEENGGKLNHVKPHGALYNMSAANQEIAFTIAEAIYSIDKNLILFGLSESFSISEAKAVGLKTKSEVFADRAYLSDGSLCPRNREGAVFSNIENVKSQVKGIINNGKIETINQEIIQIIAETICVHSDTPNALEYAKTIFELVKI